MATSDEKQTQPAPHPLKDKWFVFYNPSGKSGTDFSDVFEELDNVTTIEEVFASLNTLPYPSLLPKDDNLIFSRNKVTPKFESFPGGHRLSIFTKTKVQSDEALYRTIAAVMGEGITTVCNGESVVDVIRITPKPGPVFKDALRLEVWLRKCPYAKALEEYINNLFRSTPGISVICRDFDDNGTREKGAATRSSEARS